MSEKAVAHKVCFEKLFKELYGKLIFFANKYVNDMEIAEEQVSLVFEKLWENKNEYSLDKLSSSFLFTMVKNGCISHLRHKKIESDYVNYMQKHNLLNKTNVFEEQSLETKEFVQHVDKAIENLPPRCREVFRMSRNEMKMNKEIAETLNISIKTVERQMTIALSKLKLQLSHFLFSLIIIFF